MSNVKMDSIELSISAGRQEMIMKLQPIIEEEFRKLLVEVQNQTFLKEYQQTIIALATQAILLKENSAIMTNGWVKEHLPKNTTIPDTDISSIALNLSILLSRIPLSAIRTFRTQAN